MQSSFATVHKMLYNTFQLIALASLALGRVILEDTTNYGPFNLPQEDIYLNNNVKWSIINNYKGKFYSTLTLKPGAVLYFRYDLDVSPASITSDIFFDLFNEGLILFDLSDSSPTPDLKIPARVFDNRGRIFVAMSGNDMKTHDPIYIPSSRVANTGDISVYQTKKTKTLVYVGSYMVSLQNDGLMCFHNVLYVQGHQLLGKGCITAGVGATVRLNGQKLSGFQQNIYLQDPSSVLYFETTSPAPMITVAGFGKGNLIAFPNQLSLTGKEPFSYSGSILTINTSNGITYKFNIGPGYNPSLFFLANGPQDMPLSKPVTGGAVKYNGVVPSTANKPTSCSTCDNIPDPDSFDPSITFRTSPTSH